MTPLARIVTGYSNGVANRYGLPRYYKVLQSNGLSTYAQARWPLLERSGPGKWMRVNSPLRMCSNGIHAARLTDILTWYCCATHRLYEVELDEDAMLHDTGKVCSTAGRLVRRVQFDRHWARRQGDRFGRRQDRWGLHGFETRAAAAAVQLLVGSRCINVDGMIEQLVAEQLAAR